MSKKFTFIDLFAGCGGLSEGFYREDFKALLHLEWDPAACKTLRTRMKHYGYKASEINNAVLCDDITSSDIVEKISSRIDKDVDILVGGPPCQAFSTQGRAQDPNSMKDDPRNYLFENYLLVLNHFKPKFFVFENVRGILTAKPKGKRIFDEIISKMRKTYKVCDNSKIILLNAADYGVPQIRERVILIGVRNDIDVEPEEIYKSVAKTNSNDKNSKLPPYVTIKDAISDLPFVLPSEGKEVWENYETHVHNDFLSKIRPDNFKAVYNHTARTQNEKDRERYRILSEHQNWQLKDLQKVRPDLINHDPKHFGNRYTVQEWGKPGKTICAHLYKDGNLFIHPDPKQERTFTVREAARVQSFPDDFFFEGSKTEQYRQVGNAVPPLMAQALAKAIKKFLKKVN
ncbi:restriction endonuclease [Fibrobacter sp. UWB2]|uniref:DNA cytosine methyltransferase n=1 Tax=Fibrobacter sp. UWB2 TaxID=1964358 RepID=UPI000B51EE8F|nr:DNA cytosine methyltransferase [Fibrobacter sp. UWB2]OWV18975.1 restriction endonuclease [Fibrobacter sp. UWB2]